MTRKSGLLTIILILSFDARVYAQAPPPATLDTVRQLCGPELGSCANFDAIVFVHGIYGGTDTFTNSTTGFDWPKKFPRFVTDRQVDVYRLHYRTALLSWAKGSYPDFHGVAAAVFNAMTPLRKRNYRSIGFIAHSLGGNVVSTYVHMVKTKLGHPQRSQNAFVIDLATPVLGAQIADLAEEFKASLGMSDPLLKSLEKGNLYLQMLNEFRQEESGKGVAYGCRPVHLHAAYEEKYLGPLLVVTPDSAAQSVANVVDSPIVGFQLNHIQIAKPAGPDDAVYNWAMSRVQDEYTRLENWDNSHVSEPPNRRLCAGMDFIPEP